MKMLEKILIVVVGSTTYWLINSFPAEYTNSFTAISSQEIK
jgi:hypothetical protein